MGHGVAISRLGVEPGEDRGLLRGLRECCEAHLIAQALEGLHMSGVFDAREGGVIGPLLFHFLALAGDFCTIIVSCLD